MSGSEDIWFIFLLSNWRRRKLWLGRPLLCAQTFNSTVMSTERCSENQHAAAARTQLMIPTEFFFSLSLLLSYRSPTGICSSNSPEPFFRKTKSTRFKLAQIIYICCYFAGWTRSQSYFRFQALELRPKPCKCNLQLTRSLSLWNIIGFSLMRLKQNCC